MALTSQRRHRCRVVSYNVLSSHLAGNFPYCKPEATAAGPRYKVLEKKLTNEIAPFLQLTDGDDDDRKRKEPNLHAPPILCLQEVSMMWAGK